MAYETFPKDGKHGKGKKFDTCMSPSGWDNHDNSKRDLKKSGRNKYAVKAGNNYKVDPKPTPTGNPRRREYMKSGNRAQEGFGTKSKMGY